MRLPVPAFQARRLPDHYRLNTSEAGSDSASKLSLFGDISKDAPLLYTTIEQQRRLS